MSKIGVSQLGLTDIPPTLYFSFLISPRTAVMNGFSLGCVFFNTLLASQFIKLAKDVPQARTRIFTLLLGHVMASIASIMLAITLSTGRDFIGLRDLWQISFIFLFSAMVISMSVPNMRFLAVITSQKLRSLAIKGTWIFNVTVGAIALSFALRAMNQKSPIFYGPWNYLSVIMVVEPLALGVGFFTIKLYSMTRVSLGHATDKLRLVVKVTNIFTVISMILNSAIVSQIIVYVDGDSALAPITMSLLNLVLLNEMLSELYARKIIAFYDSTPRNSRRN